MALIKTKKPSPAATGTSAKTSPKQDSNTNRIISDATQDDNDDNGKKRNWTIVVYPESLPQNWIDILQGTGLPIAISPLHDRDVNPDGLPKKPHYHLILCYEGPTTYNVVNALAKKLNAPSPKFIEAVRGLYRYFTHQDNPEKAQYNAKDIRCLNGFCIADFVELTKAEVLQIKKDLISLIKQQDFHEYSEFVDYTLFNLSDNEFDVACNHTIFFDRYLSSRRYADKDKVQQDKQKSMAVSDITKNYGKLCNDILNIQTKTELENVLMAVVAQSKVLKVDVNQILM